MVSETVITVQTGTRVGHGRRAAGKRVQVQHVFSKKKLTGPFQTRTRLPAYTRARVHGYGLYPVGFSKPLIQTHMRPHIYMW
jgi:hypothetical protein